MSAVNLIVSLLVLGWVSGYVLSAFYLIIPKSKRAQPGSREYQRHRDITFLILLIGYSLFEVRNAVSEIPPNYYSVLECDATCDRQALRDNYRKLSLRHHPDKNPNRVEEAQLIFTQLSEAHEALSTDAKKEIYNKFGTSKCTHCKTVSDYLQADLPGLLIPHVFWVLLLLAMDFFLGSSEGRFWILALGAFAVALQVSILVEKELLWDLMLRNINRILEGLLGFVYHDFVKPALDVVFTMILGPFFAWVLRLLLTDRIIGMVLFEQIELITILFHRALILLGPVMRVFSPKDARPLKEIIVELAKTLHVERKLVLKFQVTPALPAEEPAPKALGTNIPRGQPIELMREAPTTSAPATAAPSSSTTNPASSTKKKK